MKNDLKTTILMFILNMLQRFYIGIPAILFLLIGIFSSPCEMIGVILLLLWIIMSAISCFTNISIINNDPVIRETINSVVANMDNQEYQYGQEIEFSDLPDENVKLVGRCLNGKANTWVMRLLYDDTYQIFNWDMKNGPSIEPELISLSKLEGHDKEYLVKGYEKDADERVRTQLYWLKNDGIIYQDYHLDLLKLIETIKSLYHIEWDKENNTVHYIGNDQDISIAVANMGGEPLDMIVGNTIYYDLDQMKIFLSVGEHYEELGNTEHASHHIVAQLAFENDVIRAFDFHFEIKE